MTFRKALPTAYEGDLVVLQILSALQISRSYIYILKFIVVNCKHIGLIRDYLS